MGTSDLPMSVLWGQFKQQGIVRRHVGDLGCDMCWLMLICCGMYHCMECKQTKMFLCACVHACA